MAEEKSIGITVKKEEDMPEWYSQAVTKSDIADYAPVRGCMVIKPYGYAIWQAIMDYFNDRIKLYKVENAYFPMFIPESFFQKEAKHAEGFKPEVAWVVNKDEDSKERLALRPTSETIIYDSYSKWIRSWRDLPLRMNQWCNIVRWEVKDVKMFLRSREFLWHEGHCVYETENECHKETLIYLDEYVKLANGLLAIPTINGQKTEKEKFAGALRTYTIETLMPDGKALQLGTSHDLGQGFAKAFGIEFLGRDKEKHIPWQNSWGFSTRMIGALLMMHGDDKGLILPPKIAPIQAVFVPIMFKDSKERVIAKCRELAARLKIKVKIDERDEYSAGWKFNEWELKGVPLRIEVGPKDMEKGQVVVVRRDTGTKETIKEEKLEGYVTEALNDIQNYLYKVSEKRIKDNIIETEDYDSFGVGINARKMVKAKFCGDVKCEDLIKEKTGGATSRCIIGKAVGKCIHCGKEAKYLTYFSKSY